MERAILITDGDTPLGSELVRIFLSRGYRVATSAAETGGEQAARQAQGAALVIPWRRGSFVSAQNLLLTAVNAFHPVEEAILIDAPRVSPAPLHELPAADIEKAVDTCLTSSIFLARELVSRFIKKPGGVLALASFSPRDREAKAPFLEQTVREGFKGFASSLISAYAESGIFVNAFQSFAAGPEDFAAFIEKTLEEKGRRISGRWFTFRPRAGLFQGMLSAAGRKG